MSAINPVYNLVNTMMDNREVVFFLGEGTSMEGTRNGKRFPDFNQLIESVLTRFEDVPLTEKDRFKRFLSIIKMWEGEKELSEHLRELLNGEPGPALYYLAALSIALYGECDALLYLTTNYDNLITKTFSYLEKNPERWIKPVTVRLYRNITGSDFQEILKNTKDHIKNGWPVIVKLFGDLNSQSLIFKHGDMRFEPIVEEKLIDWMTKPMVVIGYSFSDKVISELLLLARGKLRLFLVNPSTDIPNYLKEMDGVNHIKNDFSGFMYELLKIIEEKKPLIKEKVDKILAFKGSPPELPYPRSKRDAVSSVISTTDREVLPVVKEKHQKPMASIKKILILAANPKTTQQLRLDKEVREIKEGLRRSKYREKFEIHSELAIGVRGLRRALLDYEPHIVHFKGHGTEDGLLVEDKLGYPARISSDALSRLFKLLSNQIECVVLSACYSAPQAAAIKKHINYVIGMKKDIEDKAAIEFAVGFYDALGAGKTVEEAFEFGCNAIQLMYPDLPDHLTPVLEKRKNSGKQDS